MCRRQWFSQYHLDSNSDKRPWTDAIRSDEPRRTAPQYGRSAQHAFTHKSRLIMMVLGLRWLPPNMG